MTKAIKIWRFDQSGKMTWQKSPVRSCVFDISAISYSCAHASPAFLAAPLLGSDRLKFDDLSTGLGSQLC